MGRRSAAAAGPVRTLKCKPVPEPLRLQSGSGRQPDLRPHAEAGKDRTNPGVPLHCVMLLNCLGTDWSSEKESSLPSGATLSQIDEFEARHGVRLSPDMYGATLLRV